ncbi:hypothetical protein FQN52_006480 [Onygenales sp. PD_12]|nr:hypothetical protein FQN52_006480 [Onygenales sp. PD_12]
MFSSALKSFSSNISANYQLSPHPAFISGPWKVYDGKKKSTGNAASVFVFDRKSLDARSSGLGGRSNASSLKRVHEEVVERLKREASNLTRLRHPSILQVLEPVEETRNGGLMFATEPVTASLSGLLREMDDQERSGGRGGRFVEDPNGGTRRNNIEIDEIEIQKGLLQIAKGLEFLHESAGLVHGNLNPEAIYINAKSDWKISGLAFAGPSDSGSQSSLPPLALSEVLYHDPRLPSSVQLDLDYSSPDFIMDSNISSSADLFSLGLVIVALYNSPHTSPLQTHGNASTFKKLLSSPATVPSQSNSFLSSRPIPKDLAAQVLPRLITRRPAQRMNAKEFQQSQYFDNVLVSTIRFLESLPAKTINEKSQFMRGLGRVLAEFPPSVLERKVLGALLEESQDKELLPLILGNVFKIIKIIPSARQVVPNKVLPHLKEIFLTTGPKGATQERDTSKDPSLMVVLENMTLIAENCSGRDYKDDVLPLVHLGLESHTHSLIDASMRCLPVMLPILDFSTVKDDVFPPIASVFSRTSSLAIKIRGLEAFVILCGGSNKDPSDSNGDLMTSQPTKAGSTSILDKYTVQEKVVPLLKAIKTKEPAVMMAALNVFRQVGQIAEIEFIALEVLPTLWSFSLGPLLNVKQFGRFMDLIKSLSLKIEQQQTKKLQSLSSSNDPTNRKSASSSPFGLLDSTGGGTEIENTKSDFERLVLGKSTAPTSSNNGWDGWAASPNPAIPPAKADTTPKFSWSTANTTKTTNNAGTRNPVSSWSGSNQRSITPDMNLFTNLTPTNAQQTSSLTSLQHSQPTSWSPQTSGGIMNQSSQSLSQLRTSTTASTSSFGQPNASNASSFSAFSIPAPPPSNAPHSAFSIPPPPSSSNAPLSAFSIPPPPSSNTQPQYQQASSAANLPMSFSQSKPSTLSQQWQSNSSNSMSMHQQQQQQQKRGQDLFDSLI